ncbi:hypothetical protein [Candidatus Magnetobacterium casense]|uniref:Phage-Barnase-EndoU-ColicinE5/D-RelE like nuclease 3 domain-containing protein n=1 Tax=Candidatus Magnetobacterium casense TaxID=1455061 RepID=A0ABS6S2C5_9BACT|nr:hypothetical protein [Candidatus Magnetobacterium casensis]MBV6342989.1 hypothetical protein [Candidatus Magnetobacterium casensis]
MEPKVLSPQRQAFVDDVRSGKLTGFDIVNHGIDITKDEGLKALYGELLLRDDLVDILKGVSVEAADDISGYAVYRYNRGRDVIGINTSEITDRISLDAIIFEEIGHSLMDRHIVSDAGSRSHVRSLMDIAIGELDAKEVEILRRAESATGIGVITDILSEAGARSHLLYGLVNEREFLSNAFSRKWFQEFLKGIKVEDESGNVKKGSLWERFVLWVNDVLFGGVDHTTLLHKALETGADVIDRQSAERHGRLDAQDGVTDALLLTQWTRHTTKWLADLGYNMKDIQHMKDNMPLSDVAYILSNKIKPEAKAEESYAINDNLDKIGQLYDSTVENKKERRFLVREALNRVSLGKVSDNNVQAVKKATGIDLTGYERTIDNQAINHILTEHSDPKREAARGQRVVTKEDIKRIPDIVELPDDISLGKTPRGLDTIKYIKKINGDVYYVEEVRTGKQNIAAKTMYIKTGGGTKMAPSQVTPDHTSQTRPSTSTIPPTGEPVKGQRRLFERPGEKDFARASDGTMQEIFNKTIDQLSATPTAGDSYALSDKPRRLFERPGEKDFARASDGTIDFGHIGDDVAKAIGREAAPIRLQRGREDNYGETHVEKGHGDEIRKAGYDSVRELVLDVAQNYNQIRESAESRLLLVKRNGKDKIAVVELRPNEDGSFYGVTTAGVFRPNYADKKKLLWNRSAQPSTTKSELPDTLPHTISGEALADDALRAGQSSSSTSTVPQPGEPVNVQEVDATLRVLFERSQDSDVEGGESYALGPVKQMRDRGKITSEQYEWVKANDPDQSKFKYAPWIAKQLSNSDTPEVRDKLKSVVGDYARFIADKRMVPDFTKAPIEKIRGLGGKIVFDKHPFPGIESYDSVSAIEKDYRFWYLRNTFSPSEWNHVVTTGEGLHPEKDYTVIESNDKYEIIKPYVNYHKKGYILVIYYH